MSHWGYARVSTAEQDTALQEAALRQAGVRRIVTETRSGAAARPQLEQLLRRLRPGDVVMVYKVDRFARSLVDLMRILDVIAAAGATFKSLTEPLETTTPAGRMIVQILGSFAEFERSVIRERCAAGMAQARLKGVRFGRPPVLTPKQRARCVMLSQAGMGKRAIAARMGVSATTVERAVRAARKTA